MRPIRFFFLRRFTSGGGGNGGAGGFFGRLRHHGQYSSCRRASSRRNSDAKRGANDGDRWVSTWHIRGSQHVDVRSCPVRRTHHEAVERDPSFDNEGHHLDQRVRK